MLNHLVFFFFFFFSFFFSKVRVGAKEGGSHYWEMAVAITCGYGGYLLPLLAAHSSFIWNWSNTINVQSALRILMAWCFSTRASVAAVLTTHPCVSRCLGVNKKGHFLGEILVESLVVDWTARNKHLWNFNKNSNNLNKKMSYIISVTC